MKRIVATTGVLVPACTFLGCQRAPSAADGPAPPTPVKRGEYLVAVLGCDDCHTMKTMTAEGPTPDMAHRLAGHPADPQLPAPPTLPPGPWGVTTTMDLTAWSGPWGVSYAINLTPDENTGIAIWTEDMFIKAIRTGKHMGQSRPILPPIKNQVPDPVIAPPPSASQ